ncbi:MAG: 4-carboxymuconolactone decarboxylase, partial [Pseudonocardiales bacterium]|nr:4-carboxymuconolactone decarboxylase [Pseudonocardiales bacterium]
LVFGGAVVLGVAEVIEELIGVPGGDQAGDGQQTAVPRSQSGVFPDVTEQLVYHLGLAKDNGATETELIEAITHLAFYAGWPKAMSAMAVAKQVFQAA